MIARPSNRTTWLTSPARVLWLSPPRRSDAAMYARSFGTVAAATALGFALMGSAPRADQTRPAEPVQEAPAVAKLAVRLPDGAVPRIRSAGLARAADPLSPASLFAATASAQPATFSAIPVGPSPEGFRPLRTDPAREWKEEEFSAVSVVDGRTLLAGTIRIRLVGLDLPLPEQVCRTLDGRLERCITRAATQLELLTRWRRVTCHYRLESAEEALGRCRIGTSDLTERMVKTGYAWRSASPA
jgi:endonuclease YncB( thermonuclease family)